MKNFYLFIKKYKIIHVLYWIYASLDLWHILVLNRGEDYIFNKFDLVTDIFFQMFSVYMILYLLIPKLFFKGKYVLFILCSILTCLISSIFNNYVAQFYIGLLEPNFEFNSTIINIIAHTINNLTASTLFVVIILIEYYINKEQRNRELEKERLEYELNFLKAQMNPHFMFNALNSIYFLMDKNIGQSKDVLLKFSSLLRYQLYDCSVEKSDLRKELEFLGNYIELEKIRNCENIKVEFNKPNVEKTYFLSPLLLIPFVENAFKYVSHFTDKSNFILIDCQISEDSWLFFSIANTFNSFAEKDVNSSGLGIVNVKRRLEILYPESHFLEISDSEGVFKVTLKIYLK